MDTTETTSPPRLPLAARLYLLAVFLAVPALFAAASPDGPYTIEDWELTLMLGALAAVAQLFVVFTPRNQSYHLTPGIVVAAALLLPPPLLAVVVVVQHVPEWVKERFPWYIQLFNVANYGFAALVAAWVFDRVEEVPAAAPWADDALFFAAGLAAAVVFVVVQHALLALALRLARGHAIRESGLFEFHSLSMDIVLALMGVVVAVVWWENPFLVVAALAPLVLVHRTLALPKLEAEAREDTKTNLYNARHFSALLAEELKRAERLETPLALLVADLDLLREINNRYGHLAGDAVLVGVGRILRESLRPGDAAARFGGEEFCVLLRDADAATAMVVAERIRAAVEQERFVVDTSSEPIAATISIGVACSPEHAEDVRDLLHRADVAAYRAKAAGRNQVVLAGAEPKATLVGAPASVGEPAAGSPDDGSAAAAAHSSTPTAPPVLTSAAPARPQARRRRRPVPPGQNELALPPRVAAFVAVVATAGIATGVAALVVQPVDDLLLLGLLVMLVALGQALSVEALDRGTISVSAVGSLTGAALLGPRAALPLAAAVCVVDWVAHRPPLHRTAFNGGTLVLSSLAAALFFSFAPGDDWALVVVGVLAGAAYYVVNVGLLASVIALHAHEPIGTVLRDRFRWLFVYYVVYGVVGAMVAVAYETVGPLGLVVFAVPLVLVRKAQRDYIEHTEESVRRLRSAGATIEQQNASLASANALLRERATEAMESLAAAVDARDTYTAGHSRRVQAVAVATARRLGMEGEALEAVSFAALFHDIGKIALPDAVLLKPGPLLELEWELVRRHPEEGARIIGHLGFLAGATPAIRHHHERFDGSGYPDGLAGEAIPLAARVVHVADAFDSMVSSRVYRPALSVREAVAELRRGVGSQFCPLCVAALEDVLAHGGLEAVLAATRAA
jgi:diguanylate cyclase (GGDEF)-like protein